MCQQAGPQAPQVLPSWTGKPLAARVGEEQGPPGTSTPGSLPSFVPHSPVSSPATCPPPINVKVGLTAGLCAQFPKACSVGQPVLWLPEYWFSPFVSFAPRTLFSHAWWCGAWERGQTYPKNTLALESWSPWWSLCCLKSKEWSLVNSVCGS